MKIAMKAQRVAAMAPPSVIAATRYADAWRWLRRVVDAQAAQAAADEAAGVAGTAAGACAEIAGAIRAVEVRFGLPQSVR